MSYGNPGFTDTFLCSTGLPQYTMVALSTANKLIKPTGGGIDVIGVVQSGGTTGSTSETFQTVQFLLGVSKVRVSGASTGVTYGDTVTCTTAGTVTPTSAADYTLGRALQPVGSTGDTVISVLLYPLGTT